MKTQKSKLKPIPKFKTLQEEAEFWDIHDTTEYFDMSKPVRLVFPNLKPSTKNVTIRLPADLYYELKAQANRHDVPYQSYMKILLADKVREEQIKYQPLKKQS